MRRLTPVIVLTCAVAAMAQSQPPSVTREQVDRWMTELSNWGRWGKDDQLGTFNLITPEKRRQALQLAREGAAVSLAHTLDKEKFPDYSFEGKVYNGFPRAAIAQGPGCVQNGVEHQKAGIMTRGVLVDIPRLRGVPYLEPGTAVYPSDLEAWETYAGIRIGTGDAVFL